MKVMSNLELRVRDLGRKGWSAAKIAKRLAREGFTEGASRSTIGRILREQRSAKARPSPPPPRPVAPAPKPSGLDELAAEFSDRAGVRIEAFCARHIPTANEAVLDELAVLVMNAIEDFVQVHERDVVAIASTWKPCPACKQLVEPQPAAR